jgi:hypothetical protein
VYLADTHAGIVLAERRTSWINLVVESPEKVLLPVDPVEELELKEEAAADTQGANTRVSPIP